MNLPPKPGAYFVLDQNPPQYYYRMTPEELHEWGRACAEAALEAAAKECEGIWAKRKGLESGTAYDAALAIRSIKVED